VRDCVPSAWILPRIAVPRGWSGHSLPRGARHFLSGLSRCNTPPKP
jgi:hypothetical protein